LSGFSVEKPSLVVTNNLFSFAEKCRRDSAWCFHVEPGAGQAASLAHGLKTRATECGVTICLIIGAWEEAGASGGTGVSPVRAV
jgi:hypothetical protein